jgi:DNA replication protein DnaC
MKYGSLFEKLRRLRLSAFASSFETLLEQDPRRAAEVAQILEKMVDNELAARAERTVERRIQDAQFVRIQTVDTFDFNYNPSTRKLRKTYLQLMEADHVQQGVGAVFAGSSGLGKTHLARALGYAACQRGYRVLFIPCATLLNRLVSAQASKDLEREVKKLVSPRLLIVDELAYVTMSHEEANLFFQVLSRRHDQNHPVVVSTNKPFREWNQVFHGDATAHVIVDRLTEKAEIFYLEGTSYRQTHRTGIRPRKDIADPGK